MEWMITWPPNNDLRIRFEQYAGKAKGEFLPLIRKYRDKFADKENLMVKLKVVLGEDWELLHTDVPSHPHDGDVASLYHRSLWRPTGVDSAMRRSSNYFHISRCTM